MRLTLCLNIKSADGFVEKRRCDYDRRPLSWGRKERRLMKIKTESRANN